MVIGRAGRRSWGTGTNGIIKNDAMVPKKRMYTLKTVL